MPDYDITTRLDKLGSRMKELNTGSATYRRGSTSITITSPTRSGINVEQLAQFGITITDKAFDLIFDTADLASLVPPLPVAGDEVTYDGNTYLVMSIGDETYDFTTSSRNRIRVHTKQVGSPS